MTYTGAEQKDGSGRYRTGSFARLKRGSRPSPPLFERPSSSDLALHGTNPAAQYRIRGAIPYRARRRSPSFDHLVCSCNYRFWKVDPQRLRSFHIEGQLKVTRPFDRQISRSATLQNFHYVHGNPAHRILNVWSVRK